jgi:mannose/fructose/N-acetylgalactosamine-specific phosphotransferase system component IIC
VTLLEIAAVVLLGTLVGLDLASVPQAMFSRPIVAGVLGGLVVGAPMPGLAIGALLELFALDTLPVGATRNPDWGPGTVAVGALAGAHRDGIPASGLLGLVMVAVLSAWAGGLLVHLVRRANVSAVVQRREALDAGDPVAILAIQRRGLLRDAVRGMALTAFALALGDLVSALFTNRWGGRQAVALLALAATSIGAAGLAGWRLGGAGWRRLWFAGGLGAGGIAAGLWLR